MEARTRSDRRNRSSQERHLVKSGAQDLARIRAEMAAQDLLVHRAEVDRVPEIAGVVETGEAGRLAVESALHGIADEQQRSSRPMVGTAARIFFGAPPELRPGRDENVVRLAVRRKVLIEGAYSSVEVAHQVV